MKILRNGKWNDVWNRPKYQVIRDKILEEFKDLIFEEEPHKYYLNGVELTCVSNVTHMYKPPFDTETSARLTYERHFEDPNSDYYHKTIEEIKEMWKDGSKIACSVGTERHEFGESCFYYMTGQYDKILPGFKDRLTEDGGFKAIHAKEIAIAQFWEDLPACYIPILAETKVYNLELNYSGTFDILFYYDGTLDPEKNRGEGLIIFDYKTNKDLDKNYKDKRLLEPFTALKDSPYSIYKLQLALYQLAIEKLGFHVIDRKLIWLRDNGTYEKRYADNLTEPLRLDLLEKKAII